jgi:hypothetical protein
MKVKTSKLQGQPSVQGPSHVEERHDVEAGGSSSSTRQAHV